MAIDLLHSFLGQGQSIKSQNKSGGEAQSAQGAQSPHNLQLMRALRALQAGQTIRGEVLSVKGDEVKLSLANNLILDARMEQGISLSPGSSMGFQVKSNTGGGLLLTPLFTNTANDPNREKALDMAGIPVTDRSLEMAGALMEKGLPIDKQSLLSVYRDMGAFKSASPGEIITLRQMNMPVTEENLKQLKSYEQNRHLLNNTFSDIGEEMGRQLSSWLKEGDGEAKDGFLGRLQQIFTEAGKPSASLAERAALQTGEGRGPIMEDRVILIREEGFLGQEELPEGLKGLRADSGTFQTAAEGNLEQLFHALERVKDPSRASALFQKLWQEELQPRLMMEPEQIMGKEQLQDYYEKLLGQVNNLKSLAEETAQATPLARAVQNTSANLDFMNQLNQFHAYVQLPLKLAGREAQGELYVFTNRRSLAGREGRVTALLHLDMEYLGKLDVYVTMENQKVGTQFYLEDEQALDFLEQHMDILTARLRQRGYECKASASLRRPEEDVPMVEKIAGSGSQPILLSSQAFDVRA